jgi:hypothetical protein
MKLFKKTLLSRQNKELTFKTTHQFNVLIQKTNSIFIVQKIHAKLLPMEVYGYQEKLFRSNLSCHDVKL